ncbi:Fc.00g102910.m01.CDS01 [Cosmosporella sp. VM-42]
MPNVPVRSIADGASGNRANTSDRLIWTTRVKPQGPGDASTTQGKAVFADPGTDDVQPGLTWTTSNASTHPMRLSCKPFCPIGRLSGPGSPESVRELRDGQVSSAKAGFLPNIPSKQKRLVPEPSGG